MGKTISITILCFLLLLHSAIVLAQFEPAAGLPGTSAIHKDSSIFSGWANQCVLQNGPMDCMDLSLGFTGPNDSSMTLGMADGVGVVSLGDGGSATLQFPYPISNGPGADFAVFENSFSDDFLEFAFVEVSSNGLDFFRFPASTYIDTLNQTGTFGLSQPEKVNNLAGKYRVFYGTPFNLDDLDSVLNLDLQRITHVRIVDVVGCIQCESFSTRDAQGHLVNDPYPTPFAQGGFDLDAVGVIHFAPAGLTKQDKNKELRAYPNPLQSGSELHLFLPNNQTPAYLEFLNYEGQVKGIVSINHQEAYSMPDIPPGAYLLRGRTKEDNQWFYQQIIIIP
jgi:hypothetical protein